MGDTLRSMSSDENIMFDGEDLEMENAQQIWRSVKSTDLFDSEESKPQRTKREEFVSPELDYQETTSHHFHQNICKHRKNHQEIALHSGQNSNYLGISVALLIALYFAAYLAAI